MTPVPGEAGISITRLAPNRPSTRWGIELPRSGTFSIRRRACLMLFSTEGGTSFAFA